MPRLRVTIPRMQPVRVKLRPDGSSPESGMVTVETAIGLGGLVVLVAALMLALSVAGTKGEVCQTAREAARSYSLGAAAETSGSGVGSGRRPTSTSIASDGTWFTATSSTPAFQLGPWSAPPVSCSVTGVREPFSQWLGQR